MRGGTAFFCACKLLLRLLFHVDRKGSINGRNAFENDSSLMPRLIGRKLHLHLPTILGDRKGIPISRSSTSAICQRIDSQRLIVDEFRRTAFAERIGNGHIEQRPSFAEDLSLLVEHIDGLFTARCRQRQFGRSHFIFIFQRLRTIATGQKQERAHHARNNGGNRLHHFELKGD